MPENDNPMYRSPEKPVQYRDESRDPRLRVISEDTTKPSLKRSKISGEDLPEGETKKRCISKAEVNQPAAAATLSFRDLTDVWNAMNALGESSQKTVTAASISTPRSSESSPPPPPPPDSPDSAFNDQSTSGIDIPHIPLRSMSPETGLRAVDDLLARLPKVRKYLEKRWQEEKAKIKLITEIKSKEAELAELKNKLRQLKQGWYIPPSPERF